MMMTKGNTTRHVYLFSVLEYGLEKPFGVYGTKERAREAAIDYVTEGGCAYHKAVMYISESNPERQEYSRSDRTAFVCPVQLK